MNQAERAAGPGHYLWLATILATAAGLRTVGAANESLWLDEGLSIVLAHWSARDMLLLPTDPTPALYYLLHKLLIPATAPLLGIRSISIVCGVISVGLMYVLGRIAFGARGGLIAAALLSVWTAHVDFSQEARAYSLLIMLTLAAGIGVLAYVRAETSGGRRLGLALLAVSNVLAFYTHLTAAFWIAATCLLVSGWALHTRRPLWELAGAFSFMALFALPGLYRLARQGLHHPTFTWLAQADVGGFVKGLCETMLPVGYWDNAWLNGGRDLLRLAIGFGSLLALAGSLWQWGPRLGRYPAACSLIVAYLSMPLVIWGFGFVGTPIYMSRTVLFVIPGVILLITGLCVCSPRPRLAAVALTALYLGSTLLFGLVREKPDIRGAVRFLESTAHPRDIVAICASYAYPALRYHSQTAAGGVVLGALWAGGLVKLEEGLGSDTDWDQSFFRSQIFPTFHKRSIERSEAELPLSPARVLWRVDYQCADNANTHFDSALRRAGFECVPAWHRPHAQKKNALSIRRCVTADDSLPIVIATPVN